MPRLHSSFCLADDDDDCDDEIGKEKKKKTTKTLDTDDMNATMQDTLQEVFGYEDFMDGQRWAVEQIVQKHNNVLVNMPTCSGKSLCYQLAACLLPGITIVVSPLLSLVADQLDKLPHNLPGTTLSGQVSAKEVGIRLRDLRLGRTRILYLSPEKMTSRSFLALIDNGVLPPIDLVCIDEAHCMSEWSHNFRPCFMDLGRVIFSKIKPKSVLALTATASEDVIREIKGQLAIEDKGILKLPYKRENLKMHVFKTKDEYEKRALLMKILATTSQDSSEMSVLSDGPLIIYSRTQFGCEKLAEYLKAQGKDATAYHAGMPSAVRTTTQKKFLRGTIKIIVATIAFGMGIDKRDVRGVIHYNMPQSLENYVQETGRSGRDGADALCLLFLCSQ